MKQNESKITSPQLRALLIATLVLTINFWGWSILNPLASSYAHELSLTPVFVSIMLAMPVLVGALGRIPLGLLTDRFGGHKVMSLLCFALVVPVSLLAIANNYVHIIAIALFLGLGGASFAVGVPFVNAWFPPQRRGLALGIYGIGNIGTAASGFFMPHLVLSFGRMGGILFVSVVIFITGILVVLLGKNSPSWKANIGSPLKKFLVVAKNRVTWDLALLYAISFGAFVAFGVYLPVMLKILFGLSLVDAAARGAGFVVVATLCRPVGGWLCDHFDAKKVIKIIFLAIIILSAIVAWQTVLTTFATTVYLSLAVALGCGNGAIIALASKLSKTNTMGTVTGIVGACGGLGGFLPPLIMGITYQYLGTYIVPLLLLSVAATIMLIYINYRFKSINIKKPVIL